MSRRIVAGSAMTPCLEIVPSTLRSMPVSRFVARNLIPSSPASMATPERTGSVAVLRSAKRATIATASVNTFLSIVIFILNYYYSCGYVEKSR